MMINDKPTPDVAQLHQDNRAAWNEAAHHYEQEIEDDIVFLRAGGKNLLTPELRYLDGLGDWCQRAIHLQCAGGRDTLSLWNQGAHEVVGLDISDRMIAAARHKAEALEAPASWYCCDVLEAPRTLDGTADLVYTGRGAIYWLMDLEAWARVVFRLLKPGGCLYVFEGHPLDWIWDLNAAELKLDHESPYGHYFARSIAVGQGWPSTYIPGEALPPLAQQAMKHERQWTLGDIMNSLIAAGLRLEHFEEHPDRYWDVLPHWPEAVQDRLPHTFSLLMRREKQE